MRQALVLAIALVVALTSGVGAAADDAPWVPGDDEVVERLPSRAWPTPATARPQDPAAAAVLARRLVERSREDGDPRFLGQAQAVLARWWHDRSPPPEIALLRATIRQSLHEFDAALADLDELLSREPRIAQAWLTRATIQQVQGDYAAAQASCMRLDGLVAPLVQATCRLEARSLSGDALAAYHTLSSIADAATPATIAPWTQTVLAEIAQRLGRHADAERHFRRALALGGDVYVVGAYADLLLDLGRPLQAIAVLGDAARNDGLLLRRAIARRHTGDAGVEDDRRELQARFDTAAARGDDSHRRERARFELVFGTDPRRALAIAIENWHTQREPWDARLVIDAAREAGRPEAATEVVGFIRARGLEDVRLAAAIGQ